ncbi:latent-transforming growth factor beta-binding protein 2 [Lates japonicus]
MKRTKKLTASPPARTVAPAAGHIPVCVAQASRGPAVRRWPPEQVYIRDGGGLRRVQPGTNPFQRDQPRRRPSERQAIDTTKVQTPRPVTTRQPVHTV